MAIGGLPRDCGEGATVVALAPPFFARPMMLTRSQSHSRKRLSHNALTSVNCCLPNRACAMHSTLPAYAMDLILVIRRCSHS